MKRLYRSKTDRMLAGIGGGVAEYLDIDPVIVRLLFVLSIFFGGVGVIVYIALAIITPEKPEQDTVTPEQHESELRSTKVDPTEVCPPPAYRLLETAEKRRWLGVLLIVLVFTLAPLFIVPSFLLIFDPMVAGSVLTFFSVTSMLLFGMLFLGILGVLVGVVLIFYLLKKT